MTDNKQSKLFFGGKTVADFVESHEHISPTSMYVKVLLGLFALTGLTFLVSFADLGPASLPVAMLVAAMKATLVCAFFMHLKYDDRYHVFIFASSLLFVAIFFTFVIFDLGARDRLNEAQATDVRRSDGGWDDMGRMNANTGTGQNKPACSDGSVPMCDQVFPACNPEGGGLELVRRIENGCFVSEMVPSVDVAPAPVLDVRGEPKLDSSGRPVMQDQPVLVDGGCVAPSLGCTHPRTAAGQEAARAG